MVVPRLLLCLSVVFVAACGAFEDPATRLAFAIERGAAHLPARDGARYTLRYRAPGRLRADGDSYSVQLDRVGALLVWYKDANGAVVDSGSTSYHSRYVETPRTYKVNKPSTSPLLIVFQRRGDRAVIIDVQ